MKRKRMTGYEDNQDEDSGQCDAEMRPQILPLFTSPSEEKAEQKEGRQHEEDIRDPVTVGVDGRVQAVAVERVRTRHPVHEKERKHIGNKRNVPLTDSRAEERGQQADLHEIARVLDEPLGEAVDHA